MAQMELDFNRGAKLGILRRIAERNVLPSRMLLVLRAIDDQAREQHTTTLTMSEIGRFSGQSRETAKRGVADLVRNSLLVKSPVVNQAGKQANEYQIIWSTLNAIGDGEAIDLIRKPAKQAAAETDSESTQVVKTAMGQNQVDPGHSDPSDGSQRPADPGHSDPSIYIAPLRINNPPSSLGSESAADDRPADWSGVEGDLISLGIKAAGAAIRNARNRGCQPIDVGRLIDHVRRKPGAWGPGAIFSRISAATPGGDPAVGWPAEAADWIQKQKRAEQASQRDQASRNAVRLREQREQRRVADQLLEAEFGSLLDAMSDREILTFAREHCPPLVDQLRRDPDRSRSGGTRLFLLSKLKQKAAIA